MPANFTDPVLTGELDRLDRISTILTGAALDTGEDPIAEVIAVIGPNYHLVDLPRSA